MTEEFQLEQEEKEDLRLPFTISQLRRVAKQSLTSYSANRAPIHRGMSQKAAMLLSAATGLFLKKFAPAVLEHCDDKAVSRQAVVQTVLSDRKLRFGVTRIKRDEILLMAMDDANEMSRRIGINNLEKSLRFPIPLVAPAHARSIHHMSEDVASLRERETVDEVISALVMSYYAYQQKIPRFFKAE